MSKHQTPKVDFRPSSDNGPPTCISFVLKYFKLRHKQMILATHKPFTQMSPVQTAVQGLTLPDMYHSSWP